MNTTLRSILPCLRLRPACAVKLLPLVALLFWVALPNSRAGGVETRLDVSVDMLSGSLDFFPSEGPFTFGTPVPYGVVNNLDDKGWIWMDGSFLTIAFPGSVALTRIRVYCVYNGGERGAQWIVEHSSDNAAWTQTADFAYAEYFGGGGDDAGSPMTGTGGWYSFAFNETGERDPYWRIRQSRTLNSHAPRSGQMEFFGISEPPPETAPALTLQPLSQTVPSGTATTFKAFAWGTLPLAYQWRLNGAPLPEATTNMLTLSNVRTVDAGDYDVVVANSYGSVTSRVAALTVLLKPPEITAQPSTQCVLLGSTLRLAAAVTGSLPMTCRWQRNGLDLNDGGRMSGAQTPTLTITAFGLEDAGLYSLAVANAFGRVQSEPVLVPNPDSARCHFEFTTNNGTITITGGCPGSAGAVIIPDAINGLPVTSIGYVAFSGCTSLTSVTISDSVTSIGPEAFQGCTGLTSVTIGNSVTSIGDQAFKNCTSLTSITIPDSVTSIGQQAFYGCTGLTSVTIPDSVTSIGVGMAGGAFSGCTSLTSVTIPDSVTGIGNYAFSGCISLTSVTIPDSVTSIGWGAFMDCTNLTAITVDGLNAFYSSVDGVLFDESQTTLIQCPAVKAGSYTIPDSVTNIGSSAFSGCTSLTSVTIPDSVTSIGWGAFSGCTGLTNFTIGNGDLIMFGALSGLPRLANVTIESGVTSIGNYAFQDCTELTSVTIPDSVTNIGDYAFFCCTGLTSVTIPNSVTSIRDYAFAYCSSLKEVYFAGNAPGRGGGVFESTAATVYYLAGTKGWGATFSGRPTAQWVLPNPVILTAGSNLGVQANGFGFTVSWATNTPVVVEAATDLANPTWSPVSTNALTDGSSYFSDPDWTKQPARFYRIRTP